MTARPRPALVRAGDFLVAGLAGGLFRLMRTLGPERASNLGAAFARAIGPRLPVSNVARANLRAAFPDADATWIERTTRDVWDNLGRTVAEYPHLGSFPHRDKLAEGVGYVVDGARHFEAARDAGRPAILVSAHLGNWEMLPAASFQNGLPVGLIYRAVGNPRIDRMIRSFRASATAGDDAPLFPKGAEGARGAIAHLQAGRSLGILADQKMNDGIAVPFFGRPAMTASAPAQLALRYDAVVLPCHCVREGPGRFRVVVEPPLALPATGSRAERAQALTEAITTRIESWVRAHPGQWLWLHRRWPKGPALPP